MLSELLHMCNQVLVFGLNLHDASVHGKDEVTNLSHAWLADGRRFPSRGQQLLLSSNGHALLFGRCGLEAALEVRHLLG